MLHPAQINSHQNTFRLTRLCFLIIIPGLILGWSGASCRADISSSDLEKGVTFCHDLLAQGEYYRAITEFLRLSSFYPDGKVRDFALFGVALTYHLAEQDDEALRYVGLYQAQFPQGAYKLQADLIKIASLSRAAEPDLADRLILQHHLVSRSDISTYYAGYHQQIQTWKRMSICPEVASSPAWERLTKVEDHTSAFIVKAREASKLVAQRSREYCETRRSPLLAGMLAVIPGAGHMYVGHWNSGLAALMLNGIFIFGMVNALHEHDTGYALLLGTFELGFYTGNIYSAVNSARKHNRNILELHLQGFQILFRPELIYAPQEDDPYGFKITCRIGRRGE
ncbi:tol-pal system YbgF family protein [candidate division CSSED10-310 bacterium]|uniref:Tol-pal system YbgF family protein n=1 Tax=candidate division CSSED10-310 bacterium TaxID=2855610 RepID=A0ABV6YRV4_UNCC1